MKFKKMKKCQRKVNKTVREINKNISDDYLWRGRFFARQKQAKWCAFDDGSGGYLYVTLRLYDKKTRKTQDVYIECLSGGSRPWFEYDIWRAMNDFIVEYVDAWKDNPRADKTDYRGVTWQD